MPPLASSWLPSGGLNGPGPRVGARAVFSGDATACAGKCNRLHLAHRFHVRSLRATAYAAVASASMESAILKNRAAIERRAQEQSLVSMTAGSFFFVPSERKAMETIGKHWQGEMPFLAAVQAPHEVPTEIAPQMSDVGAMRYAVQRSGMDDYEVADAVGISHGYMSKVLKGTAGLHGKRLVRLMRVTNSVAPLQWLAEQMACDVVVRDRRTAERAALLARLAELERAA